MSRCALETSLITVFPKVHTSVELMHKYTEIGDISNLKTPYLTLISLKTTKKMQFFGTRMAHYIVV